MLHNFLNQSHQLIDSVKKNFGLVLLITATLWIIHFINKLVGYRLNRLGLIPRQLRGIPGIVCSPFLHANFDHLFLNSVALVVLLNLMLVYGMSLFLFVSAGIIVISGLLLWLFGRHAIHIGASSLLMGYWGFILLNAFTQGTLMAIILAALCLVYLWGLVVNLFPGAKGVSWEGHLFGFISGVVMSYLVVIWSI